MTINEQLDEYFRLEYKMSYKDFVKIKINDIKPQRTIQLNYKNKIRKLIKK